MKKPFNYQLFYRRAALIAYDIVSVVASSFLAILIRYDFQLNTVPEEFLLPIRRFMVIDMCWRWGFSICSGFTTVCGRLPEKQSCRIW